MIEYRTHVPAGTKLINLLVKKLQLSFSSCTRCGSALVKPLVTQIHTFTESNTCVNNTDVTWKSSREQPLHRQRTISNCSQSATSFVCLCVCQLQPWRYRPYVAPCTALMTRLGEAGQTAVIGPLCNQVFPPTHFGFIPCHLLWNKHGNKDVCEMWTTVSDYKHCSFPQHLPRCCRGHQVECRWQNSAISGFSTTKIEYRFSRHTTDVLTAFMRLINGSICLFLSLTTNISNNRAAPLQKGRTHPSII